MKVSVTFPELIKDAGFQPTDFYMVNAGWFHAYCKKTKASRNQQVAAHWRRKQGLPAKIGDYDAEPLNQKMIIDICGFKPAPNRKAEDEDSTQHILLVTKDEGRKAERHSSQVEVFLRTAPAGSTLIPYWENLETRVADDVRVGRMALNDLRPSMSGWAFEYMDYETFGMCFEHETDAMLFAALLPEVKHEMIERQKNRHQPNLPSIAHRKLAW